jgi:hypothetical protein
MSIFMTVYDGLYAYLSQLDQSCFTPILPTRRSPNAPETNAQSIIANKVQKTARYPSIKALGDDLSTSSDLAVTDSVMT